MSKTLLDQLARKHNTDKKIPDGRPSCVKSPGLGYSKFYSKELKNKKIKTMIEIGVLFGNSITMWDEYFGGRCKIYGIDKTPKPFAGKNLESDHVHIKIGNQGDRNFLEQTFSQHRYELIIDDGSHRYNDQMASILQLFPYLTSGGLYVVEDLHISPAFLRLLKNPHEFPGYISSKIKGDVRIYEDKIAFIEKE